MRVLASGDVHGMWPVYNWLLKIAQERGVQVMVLAGDLLGSPDGFDTPEKSQEYDARKLVQLLDTAGVPVFYIMGNDDLVELNSRSKQVQSLQGRRVQAGEFAFVGYQYSLPYMGGKFEKLEAEIKCDLERLTELLDAQTVLVSHSPALGILDPGFGEAQIGSRSLLEFVKTNPFRAHIHGHSHAGFGRDGRHFNVASAGHTRAMILDLATMQHEVVRLDRERLEA
jgi:Icc-related predicted phosphoesterase